MKVSKFYLYNIQICLICLNAQPMWMVCFRPPESLRINTRNNYLKLNHLLQKTSTGQGRLFCIGLAMVTEFHKSWRKPKHLNPFKYKMKLNYLNDRSNSNLWNNWWFDYALAIIKNIFLLHCNWRIILKIRLFACFVLSLPYCLFLTNIAIKINLFCLFLIFYSLLI